MRKLLGYMLGLAFLISAAPVFLGFWDQSQASGNPEDLYAGLFMGGVLVFVGLMILTAARKSHLQRTNDGQSAGLWAVGMTTAQDFGDDFGDAGD